MSPMESPLHRYLADIHYAMEAGAFYSALALSVAIPDICGAIEYPDEKLVGKRYRDWFDLSCYMLQSYLSAADCYAIRCSYLHQGIDEFGGPSAIAARLTHIEFTIGKAAGGWSLSFLPSAQGPEAKGAVRIPVEDFCRDMTTSGHTWYKSRASDQRVTSALARLIEFHQAK
jgi:hypothetical protein